MAQSLYWIALCYSGLPNKVAIELISLILGGSVSPSESALQINMTKRDDLNLLWRLLYSKNTVTQEVKVSCFWLKAGGTALVETSLSV